MPPAVAQQSARQFEEISTGPPGWWAPFNDTLSKMLNLAVDLVGKVGIRCTTVPTVAPKHTGQACRCAVPGRCQLVQSAAPACLPRTDLRSGWAMLHRRPCFVCRTVCLCAVHHPCLCAVHHPCLRAVLSPCLRAVPSPLFVCHALTPVCVQREYQVETFLSSGGISAILQYLEARRRPECVTDSPWPNGVAVCAGSARCLPACCMLQKTALRSACSSA